jgi:hypothetical protein
MKKVIFALGMLLMTAPAHADLITKHSSSIQLTVEGPAVQSNRIGSSYSVSGSNVTVSAGSAANNVGGLDLSNVTSGVPGVVDVVATAPSDGSAFSFSESYTQGDAIVTNQSALDSSGRFDAPNLYGNSTTQVGGTAGTLAGTITSGHTVTLTAGGPGTTATGQFVTEITAK